MDCHPGRCLHGDPSPCMLFQSDEYPSLRNWYKVQKGDRIMMVEMLDDPCPIEIGALGTVLAVHKDIGGQIEVEWDSGRTLMLVPPDQFDIIAKEYVIAEEP